MISVHSLTLRTALVAIATVVAALPGHAASGSKTKAAEQAGAILFRAQDCAHCHGEGGVGTKKAPPLIDIRKKKEWTPAKIASQILNGGQKMPAFGDALSDDQIAQLVAYLRAKHPPVPPPISPPAPGK